MLITMGFCLMHILYIVCALWLLYYSRRWTTFMVIDVLTVAVFIQELYREMMRLCGFAPVVTSLRMTALRGVYLLSGLFLAHVLIVYEQRKG